MFVFCRFIILFQEEHGDWAQIGLENEQMPSDNEGEVNSSGGSVQSPHSDSPMAGSPVGSPGSGPQSPGSPDGSPPGSPGSDVNSAPASPAGSHSSSPHTQSKVHFH